jgi:hypothetical protein
MGWVINATLRPLYLLERNSVPHCTGGWVGPGTGLDDLTDCQKFALNTCLRL